jgi:hypothetical protein
MVIVHLVFVVVKLRESGAEGTARPARIFKAIGYRYGSFHPSMNSLCNEINVGSVMCWFVSSVRLETV